MSHKVYSVIIALSVLLLAACSATSPTTPIANSTTVTEPTTAPVLQPMATPTALHTQPTSLPTQAPSPTPTLAATATTLAPTATSTRAALATATTGAAAASPGAPLATATNAQAVPDLSTIPVPKGAVLVNSSSRAFTYQTDLSVDAVAKFYQSMPPTNGWIYFGTDPSSANPKHILLWRGDVKYPPNVMLTIQSSKTSPGMTELVIRSTP